MTEASPEESPAEKIPPRTPEQHAAVRRRALPVAAAAAALGVMGVVMPLTVEVSAFVPPNILAVNIAFCAILMGAGILFYAKGTPGTRLAALLSLAAILLGIAGSLVYTKQAVDSRLAREGLELKNVEAIAKAAADYAVKHEGAYPADLLVMLETQALKPQALQSPYGQRNPLFQDFARGQAAVGRAELRNAVESGSDYLYLGDDLKAVPAGVAADILVAASTNTVMRVNLAVAFADGKARFVTVEEIPQVMEACNVARGKMGLGALKAPAIIQAAVDDAKAGKKTD